MDATYRSESREHNELNFARLAEQDAKLERRFTEMTRVVFLAWAVLLVAEIGLWFKV